MSAPVEDALIVAGGAGTRLWPLTAATPKPLLPFCGAPFLMGVLRRLAEVGIRRVWLVVGADPSPFEVLRPQADQLGVDLAAVPEPTPLDTAGGVREAVEDIDATCLVLNGDILTDVDLTAAVTAHRDAGAEATLVLTRVADTSSYGVCLREGTRIVGFVEKPAPGELPDQDAVNAGTYVLEPRALRRFPRGRLSFERTVFPELVATGAHVEGYASTAVWADLGTRTRYLDGHRRALDGDLDWPTLADVPARPAMGGGVRAAADVEVADGAQVVGPALLGPGVRIGAEARIGPHAVLGAGTRVAAGAHVADSVLDAGTRLGQQSRLAGVVTGPAATIGARVQATGGALIGAREHVPDDAVLEADASVPGRP